MYSVSRDTFKGNLRVIVNHHHFLGEFSRTQLWRRLVSLQKQAYSNILKISQPKNETFSDKNSDIFHISAQNIDCGYSLEPPRRGGSNEYPQSMFLSRNKKNNVHPCKPQFYCIKVGFKGFRIIQACFRDVVRQDPHPAGKAREKTETSSAYQALSA